MLQSDGNMFNITVTTTMSQITDIITEDETECDVNCQLTAYGNLLGVIEKNSEILQHASGKQN